MPFYREIFCRLWNYISPKGDYIVLDEVKGKNAVIGLRRCMKLIESGNAAKAFVAGNIEPGMTKKIVDACHENGVPIELVETKEDLGKACHIDVNASIVVLQK